MERRKVDRLPMSLHEALIELERDQFLMNLLGDYAQVYIGVKTSECGAFAGANLDFELAQHRSIF
jgi:glutamine synthetase